MDYKGNIAIDLTGGDTYKNKTIFERALHWTQKAVKEFPEYRFYVSGPGDRLVDINFPGNVLKISHHPEQKSLDRILEHADKLQIDAVVTHAKAKEIQEGIVGNDPDNRRIQPVSGLRRPALIAIIPTSHRNNYALALDVGANHWNKPIEIEQYAHLGTIVSKHLFSLSNPTVAMLNLCEEHNFGPQEYQDLCTKLETDKNLNFIGFVESRHIFRLVAHKYNQKEQFPDVVISEGFMGNQFIKTVQDTVKLMQEVGKQELFYRHIPIISDAFNYTRIGINFALNLGPLRRISKRLQPRRYGGALLGGVRTLDGRDIVFIKGHGEADKGIYHGISRAIRYHSQGVMTKINSELEQRLLATDTVKSSARKKAEEKDKAILA